MIARYSQERFSNITNEIHLFTAQKHRLQVDEIYSVASNKTTLKEKYFSYYFFRFPVSFSSILQTTIHEWLLQ